MHPGTTLKKRIAAYRRLSAAVKRHIDAMAVMRFVVFVAVIVVLGVSVPWPYFSSAVALLLVAFFVYLMVRHDKLYRFRMRLEMLGDSCEADLARHQLRFGDIPEHHPLAFSPDHPFAHDLDLAGKHSILKLLDNCFHLRSKENLRAWLEQTGDPVQTRARQAAVAELGARKGFCLKMHAACHLDSQESLSAESGRSWLNATRPWTMAMPLYILGRLTALVTTAVIVSEFIFGVTLLPWVQTLLVQSLLFFVINHYQKRLILDFINEGRQIYALRDVLAIVERLRPEAPLLQEITAAVRSSETHASAALSDLVSIYENLHQRNSGMYHYVLNVFLMWDQHYVRKLMLWVEQHGTQVPRWTEHIFKLEALCALGNFRWLFPENPFPEIIASQQLKIEAKNLAHPAIAPDKRVGNDFQIDGSGNLFLITGSNMSGKSTFLRTVGINLLLARLGAPICGNQLRCSLPKLWTSIKIQDSLAEGVSYFYAEVQRLKAILDDIQQSGESTFYLLDELLKGTNSRERLIATKALVEFLVQSPATGLITTHDLELIALAEKHPEHISNYHFQEHVADGQMNFDYKLKPGRLTSTNALRLMKLAEVPLALD